MPVFTTNNSTFFYFSECSVFLIFCMYNTCVWECENVHVCEGRCTATMAHTWRSEKIIRHQHCLLSWDKVFHSLSPAYTKLVRNPLIFLPPILLQKYWITDTWRIPWSDILVLKFKFRASCITHCSISPAFSHVILSVFS